MSGAGFDDLDGVTGGGSGTGVDPSYDALANLIAGSDEADYKGGDDAIPAGKYRFKLMKAQGSAKEFKEGQGIKPQARLGIQVVEGKSSVGRYAWVNHDLTPSDQKWDDKAKEFRPATPAEVKENMDYFAKTQKRFARILGLSSPLPAPPLTFEPNIEAWLKAAVDRGAEFIGNVTMKIDKNGVGRNRLITTSMLALDETIYKDKEKTKVKGQALELFRAEIGRAGGKVGGAAASSPTLD